MQLLGLVAEREQGHRVSCALLGASTAAHVGRIMGDVFGPQPLAANAAIAIHTSPTPREGSADPQELFGCRREAAAALLGQQFGATSLEASSRLFEESSGRSHDLDLSAHAGVATVRPRTPRRRVVGAGGSTGWHRTCRFIGP